MRTNYQPGQKIRVTNEYGETLRWTIFAINPTRTGERLTLAAPPRFEGGPEQRATVYTDDSEILIETAVAPTMQEHYNAACARIDAMAESGQMSEEQHERATDKMDRAFMRDDCTPEKLSTIAEFYTQLYAAI